MRYLELSNQLNKSVMPLYVVSGDDSYLLNDVVGQFKRLIEPSVIDFNLDIFSGEDKVNEAINTASQSPVMSNYRVVIITISTELKDSKAKSVIKSISEYLTSPVKGCIILIVGGKDKLKALDKIGVIVDCQRLETHQLIQVAMEKIKEKGLIIKDNACIRLIIEKANNDYNFIINEIEKLSHYVDNNEITLEDVEDCCMANFELDVFSITNAVNAKKPLAAIEGMRKLMSKADTLSSVMAIISATFTRGLYARLSQMNNAQLAAKMKVKEYSIIMGKKTVSGYSDKQLLNTIKRVDDYEYMFKSGKVTEKTAFENCIIALLSKGG